MKIIHCSDIHLDSPLNSNFSYEKAKVRKREILLSFLSLVDFAVENDFRALIIAGDLFDSNIISSETEKTFFEKISSAENIDFLRFTHIEQFRDEKGFISFAFFTSERVQSKVGRFVTHTIF